MVAQTSPLPKKKETKKMTFPEAVKAMVEGKMVTKLEWGDKNIYGLLKDGFIRLQDAKGNCGAWTISEGDAIGEDYVVIEDRKMN